MTSRERILLDCDPGIDDAFAIMCALRFADLAAVTTVSGNVSIENTTRNARYLLESVGADVPVHRGAGQPLIVPTAAADDVHGASGLGNHEVTEPTLPESEVSARDAILDFCVDGDAVIIATGPLTNIAVALEHDPTLAARIRHLSWMGGSTTVGNVTERAEFNAWADPHAVDVTMRSGVPVTMFGLNLTYQVRMGADEVAKLRSTTSATATMLGDLLSFYIDNGVSDSLGQPVHDTCAVLGVTHPHLFTTAESHIVAHVSDDRRGMTELRENDPNATTLQVAVTAMAPEVIELVTEPGGEP